jgi:hypothetical protein
LQHFGISFDGNNNEKYDFDKFEMSPVAMVTGNISLSMLLKRLLSSQDCCQV